VISWLVRGRVLIYRVEKSYQQGRPGTRPIHYTHKEASMKKLLAVLAAVLMMMSLAACTPAQKKSVNDAFNRVDQGVRKDIQNIANDTQDEADKAAQEADSAAEEAK